MRKGFTLIEILIVITIVGILSGVTIVVINPNAMYGRGRDARRQADLKTIQTGLENYYAANRSYPTDGTGNWTDVPNLTTGGFLSSQPTSPSGQAYQYKTITGGYCLAALLEQPIAAGDAVTKCGSVCTAGPSGWAADNCYAVKNPF